MRTSILCSVFLVAASLAVGLGFGSGCDNSPAEAVVVNEIVANAPVTIEKAWFRTTLFSQPIATGESSAALRVGTGTEHAYAIVRIGEDDQDAGVTARRFVAKTKAPVVSDPASTVRIVFSPRSAQSLCFGEPKLTQDEWTFITTRIFPTDEVVEFDDPEACTIATPAPPPDAGTDATDDGG